MQWWLERITTEVYGHLVPEYLQAEVNRLSFEVPSNASLEVAGDRYELVTSPSGRCSHRGAGVERTSQKLGGSRSAPRAIRTRDLRIRSPLLYPD